LQESTFLVEWDLRLEFPEASMIPFVPINITFQFGDFSYLDLQFFANRLYARVLLEDLEKMSNIRKKEAVLYYE
jgi:hypothetical protein